MNIVPEARHVHFINDLMYSMLYISNYISGHFGSVQIVMCIKYVTFTSVHLVFAVKHITIDNKKSYMTQKG